MLLHISSAFLLGVVRVSSPKAADPGDVSMGEVKEQSLDDEGVEEEETCLLGSEPHGDTMVRIHLNFTFCLLALSVVECL